MYNVIFDHKFPLVLSNCPLRPKNLENIELELDFKNSNCADSGILFNMIYGFVSNILQ